MKEKRYKAEDLSACGFVIQKLFKESYPDGLTATEIKEAATKRKWMKRVYDLVVVVDGVL
jgi:hypothetical protein